jgi:hypothetical protein
MTKLLGMTKEKLKSARSGCVAWLISEPNLNGISLRLALSCT